MANGFLQPAQEPSTLQKIGSGLQGFGAGVAGRGGQFLAGQEQQRQALSKERLQAAAEDLRRARGLLDIGDLQGVRNLAQERISMIQQLGGDPSDTAGILQLVDAAIGGDKNAFDALNAQVDAGLQSAADRGIIKLPAARQPLSPAGKLQADISAGFVSPEQAARSERPSALQERISELMTTGLSREDSVKIAAGRVTTSIDPVTRQVTIIDRSTGRVIGGPGEITPPARPEVTPDPKVGNELSKGRLTDTDFSKAFGPGGFIRNLGNNIADFFGAGLPAPETDQAIKDLDFLNATTLSVIRGGVDGRVNVQLQERFERLLPESARLFSGSQGALNQVDTLIRGINEESERLSSQLSRNALDPKQTVVARQKVDALKQILSSYKQILDSRKRGEGDINRFFK